VGSHSIDFCFDDRVRTVSWDGRVIARGRSEMTNLERCAT
jgi:hypothetical protein